MKVSFLLIISLFSTMTVMAQEEYESLTDGDLCWRFRSIYLNSISYYETRLAEHEKDTIIDGIVFREYYGRSSTNPSEMTFGPWIINENRDKRLIGQNGGKVYAYNTMFPINRGDLNDTSKGLSIPPNPVLLMDFTVEQGDIVKMEEDEPTELIVTAVSDTIFESDIRQKRRKVIYLQSVRLPSRHDVWIEGIGSMVNGIGINWVLSGGGISQLIKCTSNGDVLYQCSEDVLPIRDVLNNEEQSPCYYDLQGRRLAFPPRRGLYISNGKKIRVK